MNRLLQPLLLSFLTAVVMSAAAASASQAQFTSNQEHTILTGKQVEGDHIIAAGELHLITCQTVMAVGTSSGKSEATLVLALSYSACKDQFGRTVDLDNSNLTYTFTSGSNKGTVDITGQLTLTTTSGGSVVCTTIIVPQKKLGVAYKNLGSTSGFEMAQRTETLVTKTSGGYLNCGIGNGEHGGGTYSGGINVTGMSTGGSEASISVD